VQKTPLWAGASQCIVSVMKPDVGYGYTLQLCGHGHEEKKTHKKAVVNSIKLGAGMEVSSLV